MTMHDQITDRLSEYLDDELPSADRAEVDAHLAGCAECRSVLRDLRSIVAAAERLPAVPPERELWDGVARRIGAGSVLRFTAGAGRRFSFTAPQLAAAGIILMLLSGGLVYVLRPQPLAVTTVTGGLPEAAGMVAPASLVDAQYENAVADLERILDEGRGRLDPETVRVLEENLRTIDGAIEQSRRALEADPANAFLNNHLVSARQRKLALLRRATALTTGS
jgi:anti-sigma factor RsiW